VSAIFGAIALHGEPARREWLERLVAQMAHLGPDRQGYSCHANVGLGYCLLATSPESELERQPLRSDDNKVAVVFAGSLHERNDLAATLGHAAVEAARIPDSALLLRAYQRWGEGCLERLQGEFALAIMDLGRGGVLLAQSKLARFPLYAVRTAHLSGFATRIVPLLSLPGVEKELNPSGFVRAVGTFAWKRPDLSETCFRGIESLPPATALWVGADNWRHRTYWQPDAERVTSFGSEAEVYQEVRNRLRRSVHKRVRGRHPVACLLSGGLDSSSIACLAAERCRAVAIASVLPLGAGSADFPDERPFVEVVARHLGIPVEYVTPPPHPSPWEFSDSYFGELESAILSPRQYLYEALYNAAAHHGARVLLDGAYGELGPSAWGNSQTTELELLVRGRWRRAAREIGLAARNEGISWARAARRHVLYPLIRPLIDSRNPLFESRNHVAKLDVALDAEFLRSSGVQPSKQKTTQSPRLGSAVSWQKFARAPLLGPAFPIAWQGPMRDLELWEYCRGLPLHLTRHDGWRRYLIRAAMEGILPEEIRWRTCKQPFSPDYFTRLQQTLPRARAMCETVPPGCLADRVLDLAWLRQALAACEKAPARLTLKMAASCQGTLMAIQFLDWFERLPGPTLRITQHVDTLRPGHAHGQ